MLEDVDWKDLAERRRDLRLALLYKIVHGHRQQYVLMTSWSQQTPEQSQTTSINTVICLPRVDSGGRK